MQSEEEAIRELVEAGSLDLESTLHASGFLLESELETETDTMILGQHSKYGIKELGLRSTSDLNVGKMYLSKCRGEPFYPYFAFYARSQFHFI